MFRGSFQLKLFLIALASAAIALVVAGLLMAETMRREGNARLEDTLVEEARLAAELLQAAGTLESLDAEADRMGQLVAARVTLISADGRVLGDSAEPLDALPNLENHISRPEVVAAAHGGVGRARRHSATLGIDMLYVAASVHHPQIAFVRLALPLTDARDQARAIILVTLSALGIALGGTVVLAFVMTRRLGHRVRGIADAARRYRDGDFTPSRLEHGDDELGTVARALDETVANLAMRIAELARDRGRMAAILAGMVEGVIVVDPQGRLQLANDAARQMLRLDNLAVGRHYIEIIRHPAIKTLVAESLAGGTASMVELSPPRDPSRILTARAAPSDAGGGAIGVVVVLHDITELRRADQVRRDFVANVSHELRTPLTAVRGYLEALGESDIGADERRRFLEILMSNTRRMERLVKDLLRLARLDAGQETLAPVSCDVRELLHAVLEELRPSLEARRQAVDIAIAPEAGKVMADAAKLHDVLRNLIANATTYAPEASRIRVSVDRAPQHVRIAVVDEGPGIPDDDLSRIFERFYRVDKSRARDPGGTGLGLAIVKHLVELHGGEVRVENAPGAGASFTIELPSRMS
jgi:two-component system, OmpR family, phosphate regulon sensor histidine kinase PhoR